MNLGNFPHNASVGAMNQLNPLNSAAFQKLMQDTAEQSNDPKCTKILPATSAAPKYKFVMPTEFVMKHMSHLIEKQLQLVDDSERHFTVTLIQRRNKDKYEYMLSGWRKYGDVNQIKEGDTVLFEMLNPTKLKVSVISHGAPLPRAIKQKRKRPHAGGNGGSEDDDDEGGYEGQDAGPLAQSWQQTASGMHALGPAGIAGMAGMAQEQPSQRPTSPGGGGVQQSPRRAAAAACMAAQQQQQQQQQQSLQATLSPFEAAGQQAGAAGGFGPLDARDAGASPLAPLLQLPQRQATTPADQLAAALTAVQQLELPPGELLALMHGHSNALDLAPLPSSDLLALMQQQMMQAGSGGPGSSDAGGGGGKGGGQGGSAGGMVPAGMAPLMPGLSLLQPTVAELAAVVNQLEKQARGEGALQQADAAPAWEVLLQENVQLREDLQQWKAKVGSLVGTVGSAVRAIQQKLDPGLVAVTGALNAMMTLEGPDLVAELPARSRAGVQEVFAEMRQQLNTVMQMAWEVRNLSEQLAKELANDEAVAALAKARGLPNGL